MYKQGNIWWCKISRPGHKPFYQSLGADKKLAKAIEAKLRSEIHEGKFFEKKKGEYLTVSQLLDIYHERHSRHNKSADTCKRDASMKRQIVRGLGDCILSELTPILIEEYMDNRRADGVGSITIHHELKLLRHAFVLALKKWDLVSSHPFDKVQLPCGDRKRIRYLSQDEAGKLMQVLGELKQEWLLPVVILARETGLRRSNICNLTWKQCDLASRCIEIEKTKNGKPVWIPMSPDVYSELVKLGKVRDLKTDKVFLVKGQPLKGAWVGRLFRRACHLAGLENFRFHDLRHDFCSRLIQAGQPLHVVAALAGHDDLSSTQRYAHLSPDVKRKAIEASFGYSLAIVKEKGATG